MGDYNIILNNHTYSKNKVPNRVVDTQSVSNDNQHKVEVLMDKNALTTSHSETKILFNSEDDVKVEETDHCIGM